MIVVLDWFICLSRFFHVSFKELYKFKVKIKKTGNYKLLSTCRNTTVPVEHNIIILYIFHFWKKKITPSMVRRVTSWIHYRGSVFISGYKGIKLLWHISKGKTKRKYFKPCHRQFCRLWKYIIFLKTYRRWSYFQVRVNFFFRRNKISKLPKNKLQVKVIITISLKGLGHVCLQNNLTWNSNRILTESLQKIYKLFWKGLTINIA